MVSSAFSSTPDSLDNTYEISGWSLAEGIGVKTESWEHERAAIEHSPIMAEHPVHMKRQGSAVTNYIGRLCPRVCHLYASSIVTMLRNYGPYLESSCVLDPPPLRIWLVYRCFLTV